MDVTYQMNTYDWDAHDWNPVAVEVVEICQQLLRYNTANFGDDTGPGERDAAEYVAAQLDSVGLAPQLIEPAHRRTSVVARWHGSDSTRPALIVHGHLDVVPADANYWQHNPWGGELIDGCLWGRGAVDMKDMVAMIVAVVRDCHRHGIRPPRDVVLTFTADEEAGGALGAGTLVREHRELFHGATEAVGEVGGFSITLPHTQANRRAYLVQTAEKGLAWLRIRARGRAGHGSALNDDNAVTALATAVSVVGNHPWPLTLTPAVADFVASLEELLGVALPLDDQPALTAILGPIASFVGATVRSTVNPTVLRAGNKHNVIPAEASALLDARFAPGYRDQLLQTVTELIGPHIDLEVLTDLPALSAPWHSDLVGAMRQAILAEDPAASVIPYCLTGGTDNKHFATLGVQGYGFAPLQLPAELDFLGMFHGVDERVPVSALEFGVRALSRFIAAS